MESTQLTPLTIQEYTEENQITQKRPAVIAEPASTHVSTGNNVVQASNIEYDASDTPVLVIPAAHDALATSHSVTPLMQTAIEVAITNQQALADIDTHISMPSALPPQVAAHMAPETSRVSFPPIQQKTWTRPHALLLIMLLGVIVVQIISGPSQFLGTQGWAYVLHGSPANNTNLLKSVAQQLTQHATPGASASTPTPMTPTQYINLIINHMSLAQKLGQMMLIQFVGPTYSSDLSAMITQYNIGAVLIFTANGNVQSKQQLTSLTAQMQSNSSLPLAIAIDQEGGTVDRLLNLDGPRPAAATIGATNDPAQAKAAGIQDAQDLASYGINLNLAPVVDVTNVYNPQMYDRTFGNTPAVVTTMAGAYLQGLQQSGKVLGTLKHFPGLGDVGVDPHLGIPHLTRSLADLEQIDWQPYQQLIQQGNVHAIMVTHEIVTAVDGSIPSSLSYKLITGILRQQFGFQGVIMTDSLTMAGITAYYTEAQAAALAIEAGDDLLMGAASPNDVAAMLGGIQQAINAGSITQQRIDDSVRRILLLKYAMGLLPIPTH